MTEPSDEPAAAGELSFDPGLYRGAAEDYERFRLSYPEEMIDDVLRWARAGGGGRLLDLACGTGQLTFPMAHRFSEVWAVDQEADMIEVVRRKARAAPAIHVHAVVSAAEDLEAPAQGFELVVIGNAFHRLRRAKTAARVFDWLQPGGHLALFWSNTPALGSRDWQRTLSALLEEWKIRAAAQDRVPRGWALDRRLRTDAEVLAAAGFEPVRHARFPTAQTWTVDALIGLSYSTSVLSRLALGDLADAFEEDVRCTLGEQAADGKLRETVDFGYELSRRPA